MKIEQAIAQIFNMTDEVWQRHANPWSVYTRIPILPVLLLVIWSYRWIGWLSLCLTVLIIIWIWLNPRLFPVPKSTDNWGSKATFGERVWLNREQIQIPKHHAQWAKALSYASAIGLPFIIAGFWLNDAMLVTLGGTLTTLFKLWFCDRMVWLYEDMKKASPQYESWLR